MNVLFIGHDANRAGAQLVLLNLLRLLKEKGIQMHLLLGDGGPLLSEYQAICPVTIWPPSERYVMGAIADKVLWQLGLWHQFQDRQRKAQQQSIQAKLDLASFDIVLVNTVTSGHWFSQLTIPDTTPVVTFAHELAISVRIYTKPDELAYLLRRTNRLLAVSEATAQYYVQEHGFPAERITLYTLIDTPALAHNVTLASQQETIYDSLGVPSDALIVGGCGNAEWRKGNDLFVTLARQVIGRFENTKQPIHFVWVGVPPGSLRDDLLLDIQKAGLSNCVHLIPPTPDVLRYMTRFDVFVLCSREDPYPLVVFEAGLCNVPVVCFQGAGGSPELIENDGGFVVSYLDLDTMSQRIQELLNQPELRKKMGERLKEKILIRHPAHQSVESIVNLFNHLTEN
ncbi:glycosyltransferase family 4 protein [Spirosoma sp. BT702]|uniref:Glycosyltransferase family 4 protein n=1 Tax=Spirosoma profusum TaxID=2771354 RepID=A0A927ASW1_9BACT|nr:glycosyltransferase family 4 protein [Spirosoma profusum]MBD2704546.1 glycosyltransferase family 4 protein [Spirosoma profusum]